MKEIYFNDRQGQTLLTEEERRGLRFKHVTTLSEVDELEHRNIESGLIWLSLNKKKEYLTDSFFRELHKKLFGEVWSWAGQYRTSAKNIGIEYWKVPTEVLKLCDDAEYWIKNESYSWIELMARFHHKLVYIHPFANGNGRFSRIMTNYLCFKNNIHRPKWGAPLPQKQRRETYIKALREADLKDYTPLIKFLSL